MDILSTRSLRGSSERHEHRRNASPMLHCHSTYRNIGISWLFISFMGPPIPCTLPTVRRREFEALAQAEFWLWSSIRKPSASKMAESSCTAFDRHRCASKSQPWERSGRVSNRRKEIFLCFSGYQSCDYHLGRHSASLFFGARDLKPTPYGKADMLWRLWRLHSSRERQHRLDHWI